MTVRAVLIALATTLPLTAHAIADTPTQIDIPAGDLAHALLHLAKQTGADLVYRPEQIRGLNTSGAHGSLTTAQAVTQLIEGTSLQLSIDESGAMVIALSVPAEKKPIAGEGLSGPTPTAGAEGSRDDEEAKGSFWSRFRVAQVGQATVSDRAVDSSGGESQSGRSKVEEIIVTAQKQGEEHLQDVPIPVTVVNTEKLATNGQVLLRDYFASIPGLQINSQSAAGQRAGLTIRGIPPLGDIPTVGIVVDELPYGSASVVSAAHQPVPDIDPGDLARIEVLRGPQGTLYGASGMGGLVKFVTADPSMDRLSGTVQAGASSVHNGSEAGYSFRGSVNVPVNDSVAVRASAFKRHDPGYIDNPVLGLRGLNDADVVGGRLSTLLKANDAISLKLSALYQDIDRNGLSDVLIRPGLGDLEQNYPAGIGYFESQVKAFSAVVNADVGKMQLTSASGYNIYTQRDSNDISSLFGAAARNLYGVPTVGFFNYRQTRKFAQEVRLSAPLASKLDLLGGVFYTHEDTDLRIHGPALDATGATVGPFYDRSVPFSYEESAAFADLTYHFSDRVDVQIGARESRIRQSVSESYEGPYVPLFLQATSPFVRAEQKARASSFTYLATPRFKISDDLMVYARFASGFRPGNVNLGISPAAVAAGVPTQFNPDETQNYELGIKSTLFDGMLSLDASVYYIDWKSIQLRLLSPQTNISYTFNGSDAKSQGTELSVQLRPLKGMTVAAWIAYSDAVLAENFPTNSPTYGVKDDRLPNNATRSGYFSVRQDFGLWGGASGFVSGEVSYVGDRLGAFRGLAAGVPLPRQKYPSYVQENLSAGVMWDSWVTSLYVNNLSDERGLIGGGVDSNPPDAFAYIQPRTIGLSISKSF